MEKTRAFKLQKNRILQTLILLISFPFIGLAADPPGIPEGWTDNYAYVNGIRIHYYQANRAPEKPVIVMVHGITDNGLCWTTLAQELEEDFNIYMLDARGHGLSDPFTASDNEDTLIKDVVDFVALMQLEKPILMGHSMGAATVMRIGAEYPDLAQAIIMLDPFITRMPENRQEERGSQKNEKTSESEKSEPSEQEKISVRMHGDPETLIKQNNYDYDDLVELGKKQFPKWAFADIKYWALSKKQYHGAYTDGAWQTMSGTMQTGNSLENIQVPALILKADQSKDQQEANRQVVNDLKNVQLSHLKGTGHNLHHDNLELTVTELDDFLSKLEVAK